MSDGRLLEEINESGMVAILQTKEIIASNSTAPSVICLCDVGPSWEDSQATLWNDSNMTRQKHCSDPWISSCRFWRIDDFLRRRREIMVFLKQRDEM